MLESYELHAVHATSRAKTTQLVFGRDALLNVSFKADWQHIKERQQKLITQNNKRENATQIPHQHNVGDIMTVDTGKQRKHCHDPNLGPCWIAQVCDDGAVQLVKVADDNGKAVYETWNIRNVNPHSEDLITPVL